MASTAEALFRQKKAERNKQHSKESEKTAAPSKATPNASIKRSALQHDTSAIEQNKHAKRHEFDSKQQEVNERQFEAASLPNDFYQSTPEVSEQPQQGKQNEMEAELGVLKEEIAHEEEEAEERAYRDALEATLDAGEEQIQEQREREARVAQLKDMYMHKGSHLSHDRSTSRTQEEKNDGNRKEHINTDADEQKYDAEEEGDDASDEEELVDWRFAKKRK